VRVRRLDCPAVFHHDGYKIGGFKKSWATECKKNGLEGTLVHDLRRCAARNLSRAGLPETVVKEITGHKTRSLYRRYRIVDRRDLREASERLQLHLESQDGTKVMPLRTCESVTEHGQNTDNLREREILHDFHELPNI
jgi:Phage integrase family